MMRSSSNASGSTRRRQCRAAPRTARARCCPDRSPYDRAPGPGGSRVAARRARRPAAGSSAKSDLKPAEDPISGQSGLWLLSVAWIPRSSRGDSAAPARAGPEPSRPPCEGRTRCRNDPGHGGGAPPGAGQQGPRSSAWPSSLGGHEAAGRRSPRMISTGQGA
jgi:hypothetical protein